MASVPDTQTFNIAAQITWLHILYEIVDDFFLFPLDFILGKHIADRHEFNERLSKIVVASFIGHSVIFLLVLVFTPSMVQSTGQTAALVDQTVDYIRLESVANLISSPYGVVQIALILHKKEKLIYVLLGLRTLLSIIFDGLFFSQLPLSLHLGVNGVGWTNISVNSLFFLVAMIWLFRNGVRWPQLRQPGSVPWIKEWLVKSTCSGLESFFRNLAFGIMILKKVNEIQEPGIYWITNHFIWDWLLLPILALGDLIKRDVACHQGGRGRMFAGYCQLTLLVCLAWLASVPAWEGFIANAMGVAQAAQVKDLALFMIGFYILFAFDNLLDSYFYGVGRTDLVMYQSLFVGVVFYGSAFVLYQQGYFIPTLKSTALLFGLGIMADTLVTVILFWLYRPSIFRRENTAQPQAMP